MKTAVADVTLFMKIADQPVRAVPELPPVSPEVMADLDKAALLVREAVNLMKLHTASEAAFRARLIGSEYAELLRALARQDMVEIADAIADIDYVTIGTAVQFGLPHAEIWTEEVQRSNLEKTIPCETCKGKGQKTLHLSPAASFFNGNDEEAIVDCRDCRGLGKVMIKDAQGKVQKPAGWSPPNVERVLRRHGWVPSSERS